MNENETDPQTADASPESSSPERGTSELPTSVQPSADAPAASPAEAAPASGVPQSPWAQPGTEGQRPTVAFPQHPLPPVPGYVQQQPYGQQAGYGEQAGYQQPYYPQQANPGWQAQQPVSGPTAQLPGIGQPGAEGQWQQGPDGQPVWAAPVGTIEQQRPPRDPRRRRFAAVGGAALLIALAGGGVGAATTLAFDKNNGSGTVETSNSKVTRVVDRSSLADIASAVQDSVVSITTDSGEGSGVIYDNLGDIVTNNHVVATATGNTVTVVFANGKGKATATIVGTDPRSDLAVVKLSNASGLKPATFGNSDNMKVGDTVLAIGSPLGLEGSVTAGIISAKDRTIQSSSEDSQQQQTNPFGSSGSSGSSSSAAATTLTGMLQTDAPINPGNSGGALVDTSGEVIGINSAIATNGSDSGSIGLGFAIPSNKVKTVAADIVAGKKVSHPALGVSVADAQGGAGAVISTVTANSAAAKAGLQQGDVVTKAGDTAISDANDLVAAVQGGTVGQQLTLTVTRSGATKTITVTLADAQ